MLALPTNRPNENLTQQTAGALRFYLVSTNSGWLHTVLEVTALPGPTGPNSSVPEFWTGANGVQVSLKIQSSKRDTEPSSEKF